MAKFPSEERKTEHKRDKTTTEATRQWEMLSPSWRPVDIDLSPLGKHCLRLTLHFESSQWVPADRPSIVCWAWTLNEVTFISLTMCTRVFVAASPKKRALNHLMNFSLKQPWLHLFILTYAPIVADEVHKLGAWVKAQIDILIKSQSSSASMKSLFSTLSHWVLIFN